jgi:aminoglycoside phosphotransferase (APT) family kinase protein
MRLLAAGRDADVFEAGVGRVLRRYRDASRDVSREARVMQYARGQGLPVPEVFDADGPDLVLERVDGPTMGSDLGRQPWKLGGHARLLAGLHAAVHRIPGPSWLEAPFGLGDRLVHLDLHPENVLISASGPVIIDWTNARTGAEAADVADAWLIISVGSAPGGRVKKVVASAGQRWFADLFLRATSVDVSSVVGLAADRRLGDQNLSRTECARIRARARTASQPKSGR